MIDDAARERVRKLLAEGLLSHRQIALATGVLRASVGQIGRGKCPRKKVDSLRNATCAGPLERCPTCGGMVHMPCELCRVRRLKYGHAER